MDAVLLRYRHVDDDPGPWQPVDSTWRTAADVWVVLHDLYHHAPGDCGTFAEEIATLGAEFYIYQGAVPDTGVGLTGAQLIASAAAGILGVLLQSPARRPASFLVPPCAVPMLDAEAEAAFEAVLDAGRRQLAQSIEEPAGWQAVIEQWRDGGWLRAWMRRGWAQAASRYPDRARVRRAMHSGSEALASITRRAKPHALLEARRAGYDAQFVMHPRARSLAHARDAQVDGFDCQ